MIPNMSERSIKRILSVERKSEISQILMRNVHTNVSRAWQGDGDDEQSSVCVLKSLLHRCSKMRSSVPCWNAWECCRVLPFTATVVWTLSVSHVSGMHFSCLSSSHLFCRILQQQNEDIRRRLSQTTHKMEAMETEFETSRHYMQAELGRTRDDLEKMRDKFRRSVVQCTRTPTWLSHFLWLK